MREASWRHDGFAFSIDGGWRIPAEHVTRAHAGELPSQIARRASQPIGITSGFSAAVWDRLIRAFIYAKARHLRDDFAVDRRNDVLTQLACDLLDAPRNVDLMQDDLREMVLQTDACAAYQQTKVGLSSYG